MDLKLPDVPGLPIGLPAITFGMAPGAELSAQFARGVPGGPAARRQEPVGRGVPGVGV